MLAAVLPEQSAKRVVSQCGLIGKAAAVSYSSKDKENRMKWFRTLLASSGSIYFGRSIESNYEIVEMGDFSDALRYALSSIRR